MRMLMAALMLLMLFTCATGCDMLAAGKVEGAVIKALADDPRTSQFTFEVSSLDGTVTITGEVFKPEDGDIVTEIAKGVPGVVAVVNHVSLPEESSGMLQDEVVTSPYL